MATVPENKLPVGIQSHIRFCVLLPENTSKNFPFTKSLQGQSTSQFSKITLFPAALRERSHIFEFNICDLVTHKIYLLPFTNADLGFSPLKDILGQHSSTFSLMTLTHVWQNFYNPRQNKHVRTMWWFFCMNKIYLIHNFVLI